MKCCHCDHGALSRSPTSSWKRFTPLRSASYL